MDSAEAVNNGFVPSVWEAWISALVVKALLRQRWRQDPLLSLNQPNLWNTMSSALNVAVYAEACVSGALSPSALYAPSMSMSASLAWLNFAVTWVLPLPLLLLGTI